MNAKPVEPRRFSPLLPLIIGGAMLIQTLNSTVIVNALPTIARHFGERAVDLNIAISAYLLATAIFLPLSGWMTDRFGSRTVFRGAIIVYLFANVACGLSHSLPQFVTARVLGGASGAMMMPVGRLVLLRTAPRSELVRAMSYLTMPSLLGPVLGPPIGGFITTYWSWRWIFFINLPVGLLAIMLVGRYLPQLRDPDHPPFDLRGFLLAGFGLAGLIFALQVAVSGSAPLPSIAALLLGGGGCLALYRLHARRIVRPILDFSVLHLRSFAAGVIGGQFVRMLNGALPFLLALLLQDSFGLSAFAAGMLTFSSAAAALLMKTTARPIIRLIGFRSVLVGNSLIVAAIFASYALFRPGTSHALIIALLFSGGFFRSLQFTALNTLAYVDVPKEKLSSGSTLLSMSQPLAQSLGVAIAAGIVHLSGLVGGSYIGGVPATAPAFLILSGFSLLGLPFFLGLPHDVGTEVSGYRSGSRASVAERAAAGEGEPDST